MTIPAVPIRGRAAFSPCGRYRWWLERLWEPGGSRLLFIGLNPSHADHRRDDPTLRRLVAFAAGWGYGSLEVLNLFALVSPDPAALGRGANLRVTPTSPGSGGGCGPWTAMPAGPGRAQRPP